MTRADMFQLLEEIVETEPGSLTGPTLLKDLPGWDSLAIITFQAEIDQRLNLIVEPTALAQCKTIQDIIDLLTGLIHEQPAIDFTCESVKV